MSSSRSLRLRNVPEQSSLTRRSRIRPAAEVLNAQNRGDEGLRLSVTPPEHDNGVVSVWVGGSCMAMRTGAHEPFYHAMKFQAEVVEGQWRITQVIESLVA